MIKLFLLAILIVAGFIGWQVTRPGDFKEVSIVEIPRGTPTSQIAEILGSEGVIDRPIYFLAARALRYGKRLQAGEYKFDRPQSPLEIVDRMVRGDVMMHTLVFPEGSNVFDVARKFGLKWVELREVPGAKRHYDSLNPDELSAAAKQFRDAGLKVAFFNAPGVKTALPGTEPLRTPQAADWRERANLAYENRIPALRRSIQAAHAFDVDRVRVFTFARVAEPEKLFPRIADVLGEMGEVAKKEGVRLLVENEPACNVGSCAEMAGLIKLLPASTFGLNWDANNGQTMKERPYPDGYSLLPKNRIEHVHMHGRTLLDPEKKLDWRAIFAALQSDGYRGNAGLETHYFDGTKIEKSHLCLEEMRRLLSAS